MGAYTLLVARGVVLMGTAALAPPELRPPWGEAGHRMAGELAAELLPPGMPAFFRDARDRLAWLNPEPDRWRDAAERRLDRALDQGFSADHFIDLELIPAARQASIFRAPSRLAYADSLRTLGLDAARVGLSPFAMLELSQRLRSGFRQWRRATNTQTRAWIEQRIIDDAGILGHYVTDASNPAHTTIHFNGWAGDNPGGYTTDNAFHSRFESAFVQAQITIGDIRAVASAAPRVLPELRTAILAHVRESNRLVERMYQLDKARSFNARNNSPEHKRFAAERLAAGVVMLRDIWWTAWVTSAADQESP
jgi:hypothetical protein